MYCCPASKFVIIAEPRRVLELAAVLDNKQLIGYQLGKLSRES